MSKIDDERTKITAGAINTVATSCFTVGVATPLAAYLYNVSDIRTKSDPALAGAGMVIWIAAAAGLHLIARRTLKGLSDD